MFVCVWVRVSMHQQLCSRAWREGSALGRARKIVHPDSPAALYKDKEKKASLPLYLDGLYWASCLRPPPPTLYPLPPPALPLKSLTKTMWAAGPPLRRSEGRVSLIMIWVIITVQRKRKRDGDGMEGGRTAEKWWVEREVFLIVSPSPLNDCCPQC